MVVRAKHITRSVATAAALVAILFGIPVVLAVAVGWPLPTALPRPAEVATALEQRNIAGEVVVSVLALVVWVVWAQFVWALAWEAIVNGRRLASGVRARPAPLVAGPLNALAVKLVSGLMAASVAATTATAYLSLPPSPALAAVPAPETLSPSTDAGPVSEGQAPSRVDDRGPQWLVKDGDSLWSIAERTFGDGDRSRDVLTLNPVLTSARSVQPGMVLSMPVGAAVPTDRVPATEAQPPAATVRAPAMPPASSKLTSAPVGSNRAAGLEAIEVEIEPGDNLWSLSEHRLENVDPDPSVERIIDYLDDVVTDNDAAIKDPDLIFPGQVFIFPRIEGPANAEPTTAESTPPEPTTAETTTTVAASPESVTPVAPSDGGRNGPNGLNGAVPDRPADRVAPDRAQEGAASADDGRASEDDPVGPLLLGVGGALLAAGVADLIRRRRRYRQAHRSPGTVARTPQREPSPLERALRYQSDSQTSAWLSAAMESLGSRPVWEGEEVAQPVVAQLSDDDLEVTFSSPDKMAAPVPWVDTGDALHWRLPRLVMVEELLPLQGSSPAPCLATVGADTRVNLEALGVLSIGGTGGEPMDLVRSIVHELATSPSAGLIDVRSTIPVAGTESYGLVRNQQPDDVAAELVAWLDDVAAQLTAGSFHNAYTQRLNATQDPITPVVVITDRAGYDSLRPVAERAVIGRLPVALIVVGAVSSLTSIGGHTLALDADGGRLEPLGIDLRPQLLSVEVARELGELLEEAEDPGVEPLVVGTQLSASVTEIHGGPRPESPVEETSTEHRASGHRAAGYRAGAYDAAIPVVDQSHLDPVDPVDLPAHLAGASSTIELADEEALEEAAPVDEAVASEEATISIQVLGEIEAVGQNEDLTSQQLSLLCYLACNGPSNREVIIDALWDGQVISKSRFPNLLAETRARIGRHHFPEAKNGRYRLQGVTTDLDRFERAVASTQRADTDTAATSLRSVLALVRGVPLTPPSRRFWSWTGDQSNLATRVEAMVADAAARLARIEQARGNLDGARWACEQGLLASSLDETLVIALTEVYLEQGKPVLASRLVDDWEDRIGRLDCGEPSDEPRRRLAG